MSVTTTSATEDAAPETCGALAVNPDAKALCGMVALPALDNGSYRAVFPDGSRSFVNRHHYPEDSGEEMLDAEGNPVTVGAVRGADGTFAFQLSRVLPSEEILIVDVIDYASSDDGDGIHDCVTSSGGTGFMVDGRAVAVVNEAFVDVAAADLLNCSPRW